MPQWRWFWGTFSPRKEVEVSEGYGSWRFLSLFMYLVLSGIVWYLHYKVSSANIVLCKYEVVTERQVPCSHFLIPRRTCGSDGARATRGHPPFPFPKLRWWNGKIAGKQQEDGIAILWTKTRVFFIFIFGPSHHIFHFQVSFGNLKLRS